MSFVITIAIFVVVVIIFVCKLWWLAS